MKLDYKHLVQKPSLCGPTCLQMILLRRGIWVDQEEIARELGVTVPEEVNKSFSPPLPIGKTQKELGISLTDFKNKKSTTFLEQYNIHAKVYFFSEINDVSEFIHVHLREGHDVMVNFWMNYFSKDEQKGHYCLISETEEDMVTLCDPWLENKSFWKAEINELVKAMGSTFDGTERGFVVFA